VAEDQHVAQGYEQDGNHHDVVGTIHGCETAGRYCALLVSVSHKITSLIWAPGGRLRNKRVTSS